MAAHFSVAATPQANEISPGTKPLLSANCEKQKWEYSYSGYKAPFFHSVLFSM